MILSLMVSSTFVLLAVWHVRMAFGSVAAVSGAVPVVDGRPLFVPSRAATLAVATALLLCAVLVAATGGIVNPGIPRRILSGLSYALAVGLLARAIGEFRSVGFFKRVTGSRFARLDTLFYSPLCLLLAAGVAGVAFNKG